MYCECGCGQITKIAQRTANKRGQRKGEHLRCIYGHSAIKHLSHYKGMDKWIVLNTNKHLCRCGCGEFIIIKRHHFSQGIPKFIVGHHSKTSKMKNILKDTSSKRVGKLSPRWKEDRNSIRGRKRAKVDFTKIMKRKIYVRDNGICQSCGAFTLLNLNNNDPLKTNIDHIIPVENGGDNNLDNGQVLCLICHKMKHSAIENRVNSGKPRTGNPEPSCMIANRHTEGAETRAEETIMLNSALHESDDIVRSNRNIG